MTHTDTRKRLSDAELVTALRCIGDRPIETAEWICAQAADAIERLSRPSGAEAMREEAAKLAEKWEMSRCVSKVMAKEVQEYIAKIDQRVFAAMEEFGPHAMMTVISWPQVPPTIPFLSEEIRALPIAPQEAALFVKEKKNG